MKIDPATQQAAKAYSRRAQRADDDAAEVRGGGEVRANRSVEIHISERSRELRRVNELVERSPDVREDRVRALKASIEAGTYRVPAMEIAAKLLDGGPNGVGGTD